MERIAEFEKVSFENFEEADLPSAPRYVRICRL